MELISQNDAMDFVHNVEQLYYDDPFGLLALLQQLHRFGNLNKNLLVKKPLNWYVKKTFPRRQKVQLMRRQAFLIEAEFEKLIKDYNMIPSSFIGQFNDQIMRELVKNESLLIPRFFPESH